ncbi:MAG: terminase [Gammaproteobacteria bacterium]|nr:terminase [Gammaproteobacteria bacterium]
MRELRIQMTPPQAEFFQLTDKYPLFCAGFGAGKTETLLDCALRDALEAPSGLIAMYEPTFDLVQMILVPRMSEKLTDFGIRYRYNQRDKFFYVSSSRCADFVLRTMDNPARIVGYESYRAHVDEIDTLKHEHARLAWQKIIARNRQKPRGVVNALNRVSAYTTPEGFRFAYEMWVKKAAVGYRMIQAPTSSNPWLPEDYIPGLQATYPPQLIKAYLEGQFVNLTSGSVYPDFDRKLNHTPTVIRPAANGQAGEELHIGMDFNVNKMAAIVFVIRDDAPHAVTELTKVRDTPEMARILKERFKDAGHAVTVYPDASGANTSSKGASVSDLSILYSAGFLVRAPSANPRVKDRVNSVNALILNAKGDRRLRVNVDACPTFSESLEQQPYDDNGEPDKTAGHDHTNDAGGYFLHQRWPVIRSVTRFTTSHHMGR